MGEFGYTKRGPKRLGAEVATHVLTFACASGLALAEAFRFGGEGLTPPSD